MTWRPTGVEPVKAMRRIRGLRKSSSPTLPPGPVTILTVPFGKGFCALPSPKVACAISSITLIVASGVVLAGLTMIVLPAASAGPSLVPINVNGKFHGTMPPHTPIGWRTTMP